MLRPCMPPPCAPPPCGRPPWPAPAPDAASCAAPPPSANATPPAPAPQAKVGDQRAQEILKEKRVKGLTFTDANLDAVASYLHTVTGLAFVISPKVRAAKFDAVKVNIPLTDNVAAAEILDIVTAPNDLRWEIRGGDVWIVTADEAAPR